MKEASGVRERNISMNKEEIKESTQYLRKIEQGNLLRMGVQKASR